MIAARRITAFLFLFLALAVAGCNDEENSSTSHRVGAVGGRMAKSAMMADTMSSPSMLQSIGDDGMAEATIVDRSKLNGRKIAENHDFSIEIKAGDIQQRVKADYQACLSLGCEIVSSNFQSKSSGYLNARIAPDKLADFFKIIENGVGEVTEHRVSVEDETSSYVDTAATLKSKMALRDRLTSLLESDKTRTVSDVMSIERELSRVQSEIDSITGRMSALEKRTSMATVNVQYTVPYFERDDHYRSMSTSFARAWRGFIGSLDEVIVFAGRSLPWLPVIFIGVWLVAKSLRAGFSVGGGFFRRKKKDEPTG